MDQKGLRPAVAGRDQGYAVDPGLGPGAIEMMVANRPDWCISASAHLGRTDVAVRAQETEQLHLRTVELMEEVAKRVEGKTACRPGGI